MTKEKIIIVENPERLAQGAAELFCREAQAGVRRKGRFSVALSGGSTPRAAHRLLAREPYVDRVPWQDTHIFWVDERMLPFTHVESNFGAAQKDFLGQVPIPPGQIHPMPAEAEPNDAGRQYRRELENYFGLSERGYPCFDLIFLGLGEDGHTASLFPEAHRADKEKKWVLTVKGGHPDVLRLTLSYRVLNRARVVVFLVSGRKKGVVVQRVLERGEKQLPAAKILPKNGALLWLLDKDAAHLLSKVN